MGTLINRGRDSIFSPEDEFQTPSVSGIGLGFSGNRFRLKLNFRLYPTLVDETSAVYCENE